MNWAEFKDSVSHMCLSGTLVASWTLTQEVAGFAKFESCYCNDIFLSLTSVKKTFRENSTTAKM